MTTLTDPAPASCYECAGGLTCMHCHPVDRPSQTHRIAELEAALDEIHGAGYAMSRGINGGVSTMCVPIDAWDNAMQARNPK